MTDQAAAPGPGVRAASPVPVIGRLLRWLAAPPLAFRHGFRFAVAAVLALWLAARFPQLPHGSWILIAVAVCMQPFAGAAIQKGGYRVAGSVAGGLALIACAFIAQQALALLLLGLFLVATVASYAQMTSSRPYAWLLMMLVFVIVLIDAAGSSDPSELVNLAFTRVTLTTLGVLIVVIVSSTFWPTRAGDELARLLAKGASDVGRLFDQALSASGAEPGEPADAPAPEPSSAEARQAFSQQMALARQAADEDLGDRTSYLRAAHRIALLEDLHSLGQGLAAAVGQVGALPGAAKSALAVRQHFGRAFSSTAAALQDGTITRGEIEELTAAVEELARVPPESGNRDAFDEVVETLRWAARDLEMLSAEAAPEDRAGAARGRVASGTPRFAIDPAIGRVALRTGVATTAALLVNMAVALPVSAAPPLFAYSLTNTPARMSGRALLKFYLLFVVIALVVAANIVFVTPHLQRFPDALLVPAAMFFALGYVTVLRPKTAALAPVAGLVLALMLFGGSTAPTNLQGPWMLLQWLAVAVVVSFIVNLLVWPRTALELFQRKVAAQLDLLRRSLTDPEPGPGPMELSIAFLQGAASSGRLAAAAHSEPVQQALDSDRRASLLVVLDRLSFAVVSLKRERAPAEDGEVVSEVAASMERLAGMLRGDAPALRANPVGAGTSRLGGESHVGAASEPPGTAAPEPGSRSEVRGPLQRLREAQQRLEAWEHDWITARTADRKGTRA